MVIQICIGSACHLKGSYEVINTFKKIIDERNLNESIELKSSFCLGKCSEAVSIKVDNNEVISMTPDKVEEFVISLTKEGGF